ncbi:hypothetical protein ACIQNU_03280 [Streptomyces sp. NPDC091292]|uniref:hypothetical protein n=1 Tax=Streptomyces sp. NPDC091292 TaxID=3365991 RepID=UPI0037F9ACF0
MHPIIRYGDVIAVAGGGIILAAVQPAWGWWIAWGVMAATVVASHVYRYRLARH